LVATAWRLEGLIRRLHLDAGLLVRMASVLRRWTLVVLSIGIVIGALLVHGLLAIRCPSGATIWNKTVLATTTSGDAGEYHEEEKGAEDEYGEKHPSTPFIPACVVTVSITIALIPLGQLVEGVWNYRHRGVTVGESLIDPAKKVSGKAHQLGKGTE